MKRNSMLLQLCVSFFLLLSSQSRARERHELTHDFELEPQTPASSVTWVADWTFDDGSPCNEAGWDHVDNRILNDGQVFWSIDPISYAGVGGIVAAAAVLRGRDLCWLASPGDPAPWAGYGNDWYQAIRIEYSGIPLLSFDYLLDSEAGHDFLRVETDPGCSSFNQVDYDVDPAATAASFRTLEFEDSGSNLVGAVEALPLPDHGPGTHCLYIAFFSDGECSAEDGLRWGAPAQPDSAELGAALVVDNISLTGGNPYEDFEDLMLDPRISFVNLQDVEPFGEWGRTFSHAADSDSCAENWSCAWLFSDHTTPTIANDPSMAFGPGAYVIRNWLDDIIVSPWVSLSSTPGAHQTLVEYELLPGNSFKSSRIVANWSVRGMKRVDNTDTPQLGDSVDCVIPWRRTGLWHSLHSWAWRTDLIDLTTYLPADLTAVQVRFRVADWQRIAGASPPSPWGPGPGPYVDRVRIGRRATTGPVISMGIDSRSQAQDAFGTVRNGIVPGEHFSPSGDIFGSCAFSAAEDLGTNGSSQELVTADSIHVRIADAGVSGALVSVSLHGAIIAGPHAGKAPPPWFVGANGFFSVPADSVRHSDGTYVENSYFVDLDDDYFRGGDVLVYFWAAEDGFGNFSSDPPGLPMIPASIEAAEAATGGLHEVSFLPAIDWDPGYLARIAADPSGKLTPTPVEIANSSQANEILYVQKVDPYRRSGPVNRTPFAWALDNAGYQEKYDVYDLQGFGNTNNDLASRASLPQVLGYALIVHDTGPRHSGTIPTGQDSDSDKIDQAGFYASYLDNAPWGPVGRAALWLIGDNIVEDGPWAILSRAGVGLHSSRAICEYDTIIDGNPQTVSEPFGPNPKVFGTASFTFEPSHVTVDFRPDVIPLSGGCAFQQRDFDGLDAFGSAVGTHRYRDTGCPADTSRHFATVMNADSLGRWSTIVMPFAWEIIVMPPPSGPGNPRHPPRVASNGQELLEKILGGVLTVSPGTPVEVEETISSPRVTSLYPSSPNPFNPSTKIRFDLASRSHVHLAVYDVAGRRVRSLINEEMTAGRHAILWDGLDDRRRRVSSGVYMYRLEADGFEASRKLVVLK